jgi:hypothetical protein
VSTNEPPSTSGPEFLEQGGGAPIAREPGAGGGRRKALVVGGAVAGLALAGGIAYGVVWFTSTGPQPAEALPASTLGYASIDLDPSGGQKVEAIRTLNKFPGFEEEFGLDPEGDLIEQILDESGALDACEGVSYADDIEPWLGQRAAMAAVDLGEDQPSPVGVIQVEDAGAAEDGLDALAAGCDGGESDEVWVVEGDWMVVAETQDLAQQVVDETAEGSLADDSEFQQWTEEAGDPGVMTMYAAPEAGRYLLENADGLFGFPGAFSGEDFAVEGSYGEDVEMPEPEVPEVPEELRTMLEDFDGAAVTVRFDDGAVEIETAMDAALSQDFYGTDAGDDVLATLPGDTAAAVGVGFAEGWLGSWLEQFAAGAGGMSVEDLLAEAEAETGLSLPEDGETLAGESAALALGGDFDTDTLINSSDGTDVPLGLKVQGDPDAIEDVIAKLETKFATEGYPEIVREVEGDTIAIGLNPDYVAELAGEGDLGESETFQNVVREAEDASAILFLDFDAGDNWLAGLAGDDETVKENLEPLEGLGMSAWQDGDVVHGVFRLTTD